VALKGDSYRRTGRSRHSLTLGITCTAVAAIGTVIVPTIERPDKIIGGIIMMLSTSTAGMLVVRLSFGLLFG
jgi:hypothetical protein